MRSLPGSFRAITCLTHGRGRHVAAGVALGVLALSACSGGGGGGTTILPPGHVTYSTNPATYTKGVAISPNGPSSDGGAVTSYSVSPTLPPGLSLDPSTGVISGTPTALAAGAGYTITAGNSAGSTTVTLVITVDDVPPSNLVYSTNPATYRQGVTIAPNTPTSSGGAVVSYAVSPALPGGLTLDPATGIVTGTPAAMTASASYTVTATNSGGSTNVLLNVTVAPCQPGELRCDGVLLEVCDLSSNWSTEQVCAQTCDPSADRCSATTSCTPASRRCDGLQTEVCNSTGTAWLTVETCASGCAQGLCTGPCTPGATRCDGQVPETCDASGTAWTQGSVCATFCFEGSCALGGLVVDADANATLDGEQVFAGDVVVRNASVLRVPSGSLVLRARSFTLDGTSSIAIAPTGLDPRGKGGDGGSTSCLAGSCTASGTVGGAGGGFGTAGSSSSATLSCTYSGVTYTCTASGGGGPSYAIADDEIAAGSPGGSCGGTNGGLGGGSLVVIADVITIQGVITAAGQGASGCAGGGSGGSVVLRATQALTMSGSISASGGLGGASGAGNGGSGVVKLLYGDAETLTGTTQAATFSSFAPPDDLTSATHPDPARWYNDDFPAFELAWSRPFLTSAGYYYALNGTRGFVPGPASSMYEAGEALLFQPSSLGAGTNYFHIASVGPYSTVGTVESRLAININATPPTVSSPSHPSQTTWYANNSPYLTWTLPLSDVDTTSFHWVLDPFYDTTPTASNNQIPMNLANPQSSKQLLLPSVANGIWFFHLISQDTMGRLTKSSARYRLQIGADPGKGGVMGMVTDAASSQPLSGVEISLNRGVQTTTTSSIGAYAFINTVYAQQYEVRARKTGYLDATQMVTVTTGQTSTANLALQPAP